MFRGKGISFMDEVLIGVKSKMLPYAEYQKKFTKKCKMASVKRSMNMLSKKRMATFNKKDDRSE